jgi:hypothetical protein
MVLRQYLRAISNERPLTDFYATIGCDNDLEGEINIVAYP